MIENIAKEFELQEKNLGGSNDDTLQHIRKDAFSKFQQLGIPGMRHEEWKYTNIKTRLPETLRITHPAQAEIGKNNFNSFPGVKATKLVFVNGIFNAGLSSIIEQKGVVTGNLKTAFHQHTGLIEKHYNKLVKQYEDHFSSLNSAFANDGAFIFIEKNVQLQEPLFILHLYNSPENFTQSRNLIIAEEGSSANIIVNFQHTGSTSFYNHVSELYAGQNASVNITKLQVDVPLLKEAEHMNSTGVHILEAEINRNAKFTCNTISFEGSLVRNNTNVRLSGENTEVHMNGLYYAKGTSLIDNHILVDHLMPNCQSNQLYKGILDDEATGVFNGKIMVRRDAQKTNSYQSSKAILLSGEASVNSKPQLEIFADDVKCSHGAAIGQLNDNEVFYLRARGIEEADARAMLTYAFAGEIIGKITTPEIRDYVDAKLRARLNLDL